MRNIILICGCCLLLAAGCQKEEAEPRLDEDGLTPGINELIPPDILAKMRELGMPIYGGGNPPELEGIFTASRFILESSSHPPDRPGKLFNDYVVQFSEQNNEELTITVSYTNGQESGTGVGAFVVGEGANFSVFVDIDSVRYRNTTARASHVISGTLIEKPGFGVGIAGLRYANLMIDDNGDPLNHFIENGQGRVIYDEDGFSPREGTTVDHWTDWLPDCPCELPADIDGREEMGGQWSFCGDASQTYHYGADTEIRWLPPAAGLPGQQCTYTETGQLITGGIAAGSPDKVSPRSCGSPTRNTCDHVAADVIPWGDTGFFTDLCFSTSTRPVPCTQYLDEWRPNAGAGCPEVVVSGIDHLQRVIGRMHCEDATRLLRIVHQTPSLSPEVKAYFRSAENPMPPDLKQQLIDYRSGYDCSLLANKGACEVLQTAIRNL